MPGVVDEAIGQVDSVLEWLAVEPVHRYNWHKAEDDILRHWFGRISPGALARRVSAVLRERTGDSETERTPAACVCRAYQIGLRAYNGEPDEIHLKAAAELCELPYDTLVRAANSGELAAVRRGKQRYVRERDLSAWFVMYRDRLVAQSEAIWLLEQDTVSKREAMAITGLGETHLTRYLACGVIKAWKVPDLSGGDRGEWYVDRRSVEAFVRIRAEGNLSEILDNNPSYVELRNELTADIRHLRRAGRLEQRDPLIDPRSVYHPGCFTVKQVASHVGLSTQSVYEAIKNGHLKAEMIVFSSRPRYAVSRPEARRFARWVKERDWPIKRYHNRQRQQIAEAGLLTVRELAERWSVCEGTIHRYVRDSGLPARRWGRYLVFEPDDVQHFEGKHYG